MSKTVSDLAYWLCLWRAPRVGVRTFMQLLNHFLTPEQVFKASINDYAGFKLHEETKAYLQAPDWDAVEKDLTWLQGANNYILTLEDARYPQQLKAIADPPPILFVHGHPDVLHYPQLAMVGSRNASASSLKIATDFAHNLAQRGIIITSGLALGVDAASHQGALKANGISVAVTGTGLDRVYPARHRSLAHELVEQGALVSEFPIGSPPIAHHFPQRNRIISGLSVGTLVVEAGLKSGSLITARRALEQNREIFAIPGSIHNPLARGCHALIKQGAKLIETADDILEEIAPLLQIPDPITTESNSSQPEWDEEYQVLLDHLGYEPVAVDVLVGRSGLDADKIASMLLLLELEGYVMAEVGGLYTQIKK